MKMTLQVDEALLTRVMKSTGAASKAVAVDLALRELDRRSRMVHLTSAGLGASPSELVSAVDPAYDLEALRTAESPAPYGRKPRTR
jgi:Arc/MetJ family transcription regulator